VSMLLGKLRSWDGNMVEVDKSHVTTASVLFDAIYIPGGRESVESMKKQGDVIHFINEAYKHCKPIGATAEAVELLEFSSIRGVNYSHGHESSADMGVVTSRDPQDCNQFNQMFIQAIAHHRHWAREAVKSAVPA
jgi:catalase